MSLRALSSLYSGFRSPLGVRALATVGLVLAAGAVTAQEGSVSPGSEPVPSLVAQALAYEHGEGVPKDQIRAARLYCEAARNGEAEAQFNLGWMYANGRGVARDDG
ncbi:MAG: sel1 repeat family protein, partial [Betaproteobacteria bacterium]